MLFLLGGCSDPETNDTDAPNECRLNSDCPVGLVCVDGVCEAGDVCVGDDCPCTSNADCAIGQGCDITSGQCFDLECVADSGCPLGDICRSGRCITDVTADRDQDGVPDNEDLCPDTANPPQEDNDGDGQGDACDNDDDNDAIPDTLDNCPLIANPIQGNADGDSNGNACDDDTPGIDVRGTIDFSALPSAPVADAQVFISGRDEPVGIDSDGNYAFDNALAEPGRYFIQVRWDAFAPQLLEITAPDGTPTLEIAPMVLTPANQGDTAIAARGMVQLQGSDAQEDIVVRARIEGTLVDTTLTDSEGRFALALAPTNHTLSFSKTGFEPLEITAVFNNQGELEGRFSVDGQPLEEATLTMTPIPQATLSGLVASDTLENLRDWPERAVTTLLSEDQSVRRVAIMANAQQGQGQFQFVGLEPGSYTLNINARGHLPFTSALELVQGDNNLEDLLGQSVITLEAEDNDTAALMQGTVQLQGEDRQDGNNGGVLVRASVQGNIVGTSISSADGVFVFLASRQNHTLTFSKANYLPRDIPVVWDEVQNRFEVDETPLNDIVITLSLQALSDLDADGVIDALDNCPRTANPNQDNLDGDDQGDACDVDRDGDLIFNGLDNCPLTFNPMQDDFDGLGRGDACTAASARQPLLVGCGISNQHLDTRERPNELRASCGGTRAGELVYQLGVQRGEEWTVEVEAEHPAIIYLLDADGNEVECIPSRRATFGRGLDPGQYLVVIDGLGSDLDAGPVKVSIQSPQSCAARFTQVQSATTSIRQSRAAALADFNEDGVLDLLSAEVAEGVALYTGNGNGTFSQRQTISSEHNSRWVQTSDLNNDGHADIVFGNHSDNEVKIALGRGDGTFDPSISLPAGQEPEQFILGDIQGDGIQDLLISSRDDNTLTVWRGNGDGTFSQRQDYGGINRSWGMKLSDIDLDGRMDLIMSSGDDDSVNILKGTARETFAAPINIGVGRAPRGIDVGDVNNDGWPDLLVANSISYNVEILFGDPQGAFERREFISLGTNQVDVLALHDFNGDGHLDLTLTLTFTRTLVFYQNNGQGAFTEFARFDTPQNPDNIALGDVNNDGTQDVIVLQGAAIDNNPSPVFTHLNSPQADYAPQSNTFVGDRPNGLTTGDLNSDGHLDAVITHNNSDDVWIMLGSTQGTFQEHQRIAQNAPRAPKLGDLNSDGVLDLAFINNDGATAASIMLGRGDGTFEALRDIEPDVNGEFEDLHIADLNNDGHQDLVVAKNTPRSHVFVALGAGDGTFPQEFVDDGFLPNDNLQSVTLGDINTDGILDIVAISPVNTAAVSALGNGDGTFGEPQHHPLPRLALDRHVMEDLNGDGTLDIVTPSISTNDCYILAGNGDGTFAVPQLIAQDHIPRFVETMDYDADGQPELLIAFSNSTDIEVWQNQPDGTFERIHSFAGLRIYQLLAADVNGDGQSDLLTLNIDDSLGTILSRKTQTRAARQADSSLPPCDGQITPLQNLPGSAQAFIPIIDAPCRVNRLTLDLSFAQESRGAVALASPDRLAVDLSSTPAPNAAPGLWRPESITALARFESTPLSGQWKLHTEGLEIDSAQMLINTYPEDPFNPDTQAELCTPDLDQPDVAEFFCRLPRALLPPLPDEDTPDDDFVLEDAQDEDVFLLEGDFAGAFIRGQTIEVQVAAAANTPLKIELRAALATQPLATAIEVAPGLWGLFFTVPPEYSGRYFAVHIQAEGAQNLPYELRAGAAP